MKGFRLIIFILSVLLLTISSGLLFYKNLFLMDSPISSRKFNFEELHNTDLQINATAAMLRVNLSTDPIALQKEITRLRELLNIITDLNKSTPELNQSMKKIISYFDQKIIGLDKFLLVLKELKMAIESLSPAYSELTQNKIKFSVDNKDFYRECIMDALFYIAVPSKFNENRLNEDKKVLSQIIAFAKTPNPYIQKFHAHIDIILKRTNEIGLLTQSFDRDNSINNELAIVGKYFKESEESKARDGEIFLSMVFGAIVLYLISVVFILKKLT